MAHLLFRCHLNVSHIVCVCPPFFVCICHTTGCRTRTGVQRAPPKTASAAVRPRIEDKSKPALTSSSATLSGFQRGSAFGGSSFGKAALGPNRSSEMTRSFNASRSSDMTRSVTSFNRGGPAVRPRDASKESKVVHAAETMRARALEQGLDPVIARLMAGTRH